jgi:hypothetical protein
VGDLGRTRVDDSKEDAVCAGVDDCTGYDGPDILEDPTSPDCEVVDELTG